MKISCSPIYLFENFEFVFAFGNANEIREFLKGAEPFLEGFSFRACCCKAFSDTRQKSFLDFLSCLLIQTFPVTYLE